MKVKGGGNLRTMNPAADREIEDTRTVSIFTGLGEFKVRERDDGSLLVSGPRGNRISLMPNGSNEVVVTVEGGGE